MTIFCDDRSGLPELPKINHPNYAALIGGCGGKNSVSCNGGYDNDGGNNTANDDDTEEDEGIFAAIKSVASDSWASLKPSPSSDGTTESSFSQHYSALKTDIGFLLLLLDVAGVDGFDAGEGDEIEERVLSSRRRDQQRSSMTASSRTSESRRRYSSSAAVATSGKNRPTERRTDGGDSDAATVPPVVLSATC